MKKLHFLMKRLSLLLTAAALPLMGFAQRVSLPYGYAARGGMSYCPNTYLPGWMAVDPDQLVQDATFLIGNPGFESGDAEPWSGNPGIIEEEGLRYASMSGKFDVHQVIENIPNGVYELSVNGFYEGQKSRREAYVYAGMEAMALKSKAEGNGDLSSGHYARTVRAVVINHRLRIGVKGVYSDCGATSFDNFSLSYVGKYVVGFATATAENYTGEGAGTVPVGSWEAGQQVAVHADNASYQYEALGNGASTKLIASENGSPFPRVNLSYTAVRPYNADDATNNTLTLSPTQIYFENGINTLANPMAAIINQGDDLSFSFKNVCGLLQLNLTGDNVGVTSINVKANDGKKLYGTGTLSFDANGNPTWSCTDGGDNVTLSHTTTIALNNTATPFYIALPPATYGSLTVTVTDGEDGNTCTIELGETTITRSEVKTENKEVVYKSINLTDEFVKVEKPHYSNTTQSLSYTVVGGESSDITWSSSDPDVATVAGGTITAKNFGRVVVTATINNTNIYDACTVNVVPVGATPGLFSVSETQQVYFSKGNLYHDEASWNFEANQYDYRTYNSQPAVINGASTTTQSDHWGLFGWSTTTNLNWGMNTSQNVSDYLGDFSDWGVNAISNGGNTASQWSTPSKDVWDYLITQRRGAKVSHSYAKVTVNGVKGLMLFPDGFDFGNWPSGAETAPESNYDNGSGNYGTYTYTTASFGVLEGLGVVFLPCAGYRDSTTVYGVSAGGNYWSSTNNGTLNAYGLNINTTEVNPAGSSGRKYGKSVRLVTPLPIPATNVSLDNATMVIGKTGDVNEVKRLRATLSPSNSTDAVTWTSSHPNIATVDETGKVTPVATGTTVITATAREGVYATCTVQVVTLKGFSVSATDKVHFSTGNLTYGVTDSKWTFYGNQYDHASGYDASLISLFCWGYNETNSIKPDDYTTNSSFNDWGDADAVKGDIGNGWRTLAKNEWTYLLNTRTMTNGKPRYTNKSDGVEIGDVTYKGLFVYPDDYNGAEVGSGGPSTWDAINSAGIVFLPRAGYRNGSTVGYVGKNGSYWSSTAFVDPHAYALYFISGGITPADHDASYFGFSVRLATLLTVPATSVSLEPTTMSLEAGKTQALTATLYPLNSTDAVTWSSSNTGVATVSPTAGSTTTVTANAAGTATITATASNGLTATCTVHVAPVGAIPGLFSVSSTKQVYFSKGNLYYNGSSWCFEDNQYDYHTYEGEEAVINGASTSTPDGHWGLFGWSTSTNIYGMSTSTDDFQGEFVDWGENKISNGGNTADQWHTLTQAEWAYLLNTRTMTNNGKPCYTNKSDGVSIGEKTYNGLFIYPDNYNGTEVGSGGPSTWDAINGAGIVFLPCAGYRNGTTVNNVGTNGRYWSSTAKDDTGTYFLQFYSSGIIPTVSGFRSYGFSVRLVCFP